MSGRKKATHDSITIIKEKKLQVGAFLVFTVLVLIVLLLFAINPMLSKIAELKSEIERKKVLSADLNKKIESMSNLDNEFVEFEEFLLDMPLIFPSDLNYSYLVVNMDRICSNYGFKLQSISFDAADLEHEFTHLEPLSISMSIYGEERRLFSLLDYFEDLPNYAVLGSFNFQSEDQDLGEGEEREGFKSYAIRLTAFYISDTGFYNLFDF